MLMFPYMSHPSLTLVFVCLGWLGRLSGPDSEASCQAGITAAHGQLLVRVVDSADMNQGSACGDVFHVTRHKEPVPGLVSHRDSAVMSHNMALPVLYTPGNRLTGTRGQRSSCISIKPSLVFLQHFL